MSASSNDRGNERSGGGGGDEEESGGGGGGWLTTYSDMVTLLLTFMVLMLAMSSTDESKMEMFMLAISQDGITAEQFWEIQDRYNFEDLDLESWDEMWPLPGAVETEPEDQDRGGEAALQALHDEMAEYIDREDLGEVISLTFNGEFLLMILASDILFDSGMADITPEMLESSEVIASIIAATFEPNDPFEIVVIGHTDNVPMNTVQYPSNWHLSMGRASNFLYELVSRSHIDPGLFYARACGEYRPIATNETPEGRQMNRRVEVMVSLARDNPLWDRTGQPETSRPEFDLPETSLPESGLTDDASPPDDAGPPEDSQPE